MPEPYCKDGQGEQSCETCSSRMVGTHTVESTLEVELLSAGLLVLIA